LLGSYYDNTLWYDYNRHQPVATTTSRRHHAASLRRSRRRRGGATSPPVTSITGHGDSTTKCCDTVLQTTSAMSPRATATTHDNGKQEPMTSVRRRWQHVRRQCIVANDSGQHQSNDNGRPRRLAFEGHREAWQLTSPLFFHNVKFSVCRAIVV
jgi:hypothetical protein